MTQSILKRVNIQQTGICINLIGFVTVFEMSAFIIVFVYVLEMMPGNLNCGLG